MIKGINEIFEMLKDNKNIKIQKEGIKEAKKIKYFSILFQPREDKLVWENCAKIIAEKTDKELENYTDKLLEWLQDSNWPGYDTIYRRIREIPIEYIEGDIVYNIKKARKIGYEQWLDNLESVIDNTKLYTIN